MEDLTKINNELSAALTLYKSQLDIAIEGLRNIEDCCDPYRIAKKTLIEIDDLGQK